MKGAAAARMVMNCILRFDWKEWTIINISKDCGVEGSKCVAVFVMMEMFSYQRCQPSLYDSHISRDICFPVRFTIFEYVSKR